MITWYCQRKKKGSRDETKTDSWVFVHLVYFTIRGNLQFTVSTYGQAANFSLEKWSRYSVTYTSRLKFTVYSCSFWPHVGILFSSWLWRPQKTHRHPYKNKKEHVSSLEHKNVNGLNCSWWTLMIHTICIFSNLTDLIRFLETQLAGLTGGCTYAVSENLKTYYSTSLPLIRWLKVNQSQHFKYGDHCRWFSKWHFRNDWNE